VVFRSAALATVLLSASVPSWAGEETAAPPKKADRVVIGAGPSLIFLVPSPEEVAPCFAGFEAWAPRTSIPEFHHSQPNSATKFMLDRSHFLYSGNPLAIRLLVYHCLSYVSVPSVDLHVAEFTFLGGFESLPLRQNFLIDPFDFYRIASHPNVAKNARLEWGTPQ